MTKMVTNTPYDSDLIASLVFQGEDQDDDDEELLDDSNGSLHDMMMMDSSNSNIIMKGSNHRYSSRSTSNTTTKKVLDCGSPLPSLEKKMMENSNRSSKNNIIKMKTQSSTPKKRNSLSFRDLAISDIEHELSQSCIEFGGQYSCSEYDDNDDDDDDDDNTSFNSEGEYAGLKPNFGFHHHGSNHSKNNNCNKNDVIDDDLSECSESSASVISWRKPDWVLNREKTLKSSDLGSSIRNGLTLEKPITHINSLSDHESIKWEKPTWTKQQSLRLRKTNNGHKLRKQSSCSLAKPITHINRETNEQGKKLIDWSKPEWTKERSARQNRIEKTLQKTGNIALGEAYANLELPITRINDPAARKGRGSTNATGRFFGSCDQPITPITNTKNKKSSHNKRGSKHSSSNKNKDERRRRRSSPIKPSPVIA